MRGRHQQSSGAGSRLRWLAGVGALVAAGATGAMTFADAASGAPTPTPSYHAGSDNATFTVTGVLDSNCLISTGGTEVWIKPGDVIKFNSSLVGVDVAGLSLPLLGQVAGLNVNAVIDGNTTHKQTVTVAGGKTTAFPSSTQSSLRAGDHRLTWTASSVALLGGLASVPLSNGDLKSGASLSWSGVIHVTNDAPNCKISVGTPEVKISAGPIKITVPPIKVGLPGVKLPPVKLPSVGNLLPKPGTKTTHPASQPKRKPTSATKYRPPGMTIPEQVVPRGSGDAIFGSGDGGFHNGALPGGGSRLGNVSSSPGSGSSGAAAGPLAKQDSAGKNKTVDLASSTKSPSGQLPVILAILAIIALALVAGTYARLFLVRRNS